MLCQKNSRSRSVTHAFNPSMGPRGSRSWGQPALHSKVQDSQSYTAKACFKKQNKKDQKWPWHIISSLPVRTESAQMTSGFVEVLPLQDLEVHWFKLWTTAFSAAHIDTLPNLLLLVGFERMCTWPKGASTQSPWVGDWSVTWHLCFALVSVLFLGVS